jgi:hypothetical protein
MLKTIPTSDISIRPFKAYKEWQFVSSSAASSSVYVYNANNSGSVVNNWVSETLNNPIGDDITYYPVSIYGQLTSQFYNEHIDNPFLRFGDKTNVYDDTDAYTERFLSGSAKVISIPQKYIGEGIKRGSVYIVDGEFIYQDDSHGNLICTSFDRLHVNVSALDNQSQEFDFTDMVGNVYSSSLNSVDLPSQALVLEYNSQTYTGNLVSFDTSTELMSISGLSFIAADNRAGNVFYSQGIITITNEPATKLLNNWTLSYRSTETIYENEFLLIVEPDEYNISTNPSAVISVGKEQSTFTDSDGIVRHVVTSPGVKYIRKASTLPNGTALDYRYHSSVSSSVYAGFEHWEKSGSVDTTGSFLAPFITTIGLYDDNNDLVAVAKLPQPIKTMPDYTVNFIVRFDT